MKQGIKAKLLYCLIGMTMMIGLLFSMNCTALAEVWVGGTAVSSQSSGQGWTYDVDNSTLTLDGFNFSGEGHSGGGGSSYAIYADGNLAIEVKGTNSVKCTNPVDSGIYIGGTLEIKGSGTAPELSITAENHAVHVAGQSATFSNLNMKLSGILGIVEDNENGPNVISIDNCTISFAKEEKDAFSGLSIVTRNGYGKVEIKNKSIVTLDGNPYGYAISVSSLDRNKCDIEVLVSNSVVKADDWLYGLNANNITEGDILVKFINSTVSLQSINYDGLHIWSKGYDNYDVHGKKEYIQENSDVTVNGINVDNRLQNGGIVDGETSITVVGGSITSKHGLHTVNGVPDVPDTVFISMNGTVANVTGPETYIIETDKLTINSGNYTFKNNDKTWGMRVGEGQISGGYYNSVIDARLIKDGYAMFSNTDPKNRFTYPYVIRPAVTVTYDENDDNESQTKTETVQKGVEIQLTDIETIGFTRGNYIFTGWNTKADGTGTAYYDGQSVTLNDNVTLYAQWVEPATAPTISAQPGNLTLTYGYTEGSLSVTAAAATDTTYDSLTYQWYSCKSDGTEGTAIDTTQEPTAAQATYAIPTGKGAGTYYYYCDVTATRKDNGQQATAKSKTATVTVTPAPIGTVAVLIDAPAATEPLDTEATSLEQVSLSAVTWNPVTTPAAYATVYTATVKATAVTNYVFDDQTTATVNGQSATVAFDPKDGTLSVSFAFDKTALTPVTITPVDKEAVYSPDGIAIPVEGMFVIPEGAGKATYTVDNGTGAGCFADGKLKVAKCGDFTVTVNTAATETQDKAAANAKLTVKPAEGVPATVTGNTLKYNGTAQALVTVDASTLVGDAMVYALGTDASAAPADGWSTSIPERTDAGTYYVWYRVKGGDNHNDTVAKCATARILAPISATVTFKVVNGAWDDGSAEDVTVTLSGFEGDTLNLTAEQIPAVGNRPAADYMAGGWVVTPIPEAAIKKDTTYTYTYLHKYAIFATVTFKVVGGAWDDGTTGDRTVLVHGYEGDTLRLSAEQIPAVGGKPAESCKAGAWDVTPSTETAITENMTYTYSYAKKDAISATVTFKVVGGAWDDGTIEDKTVTLTGYEGDTLKLTATDIPAVGNKPDDTFKAGGWDVTPSTETAITKDTTYNYSYAQKSAKSATVTFKVVGGAWDDGTTEDKTVTLTGYEGDTLKLTATDIPAVGSKPAENNKAGGWDVTPNTETAITGDTIYTYTYEAASAPDEKPAAVVTKAPAAKKAKYNGKRQKLVTAGTAEGGTMVYAVTKRNEAPEASAYAGKLPAKKSAGAYYVWYKAVGDAEHADSKAAKVRVIVNRRSIGKCKITVRDLSYTGKALKPKVTVKYGKTKLKEGRDYKLTYSKKLVNPGKWRVKVTGKGNFKGSKKLAFKVNMPAIKSYKRTSGSTWIKVAWSQKAKIGRCQIQVSQKKDFSDKISKKFKISEKTEKHAKTVKGLQPDMKYYVRIRTYKTVGKKTYYSAWSEVKTIKTKTSTKNNAQSRSVEMTVGEVSDLNTLLSQEEIEAVRSWSSDGTETAAVSPEGVVTAMQPGEAAVTAILEDDEAIEFTITVRENDIVLLDIGEGDLMIDLDEDVLGNVLEDVETNFEIGEM